MLYLASGVLVTTTSDISKILDPFTIQQKSWLVMAVYCLLSNLIKPFYILVLDLCCYFMFTIFLILLTISSQLFNYDVKIFVLLFE